MANPIFKLTISELVLIIVEMWGKKLYVRVSVCEGSCAPTVQRFVEMWGKEM